MASEAGEADAGTGGVVTLGAGLLGVLAAAGPALSGVWPAAQTANAETMRMVGNPGENFTRFTCWSTDPWRSRGGFATIRSLDKGGRKLARGPEAAFARRSDQPLARAAARAAHRVTRDRSE